MQKAVPEGVGAMTAVLSCTVPRLEALCAESAKADEPVDIVNFNSASQLVVAGHADAVARLEEKLAGETVKFVKLAVSAPFHSKMMAPARVEMTPKILATKFTQNKNPVIPNLTAEVTVDYGADYLLNQIDSPVKWLQCIEAASRAEVTKFVEIGPGRVLVGLARRILPKGSWVFEATDS